MPVIGKLTETRESQMDTYALNKLINPLSKPTLTCFLASLILFLNSFTALTKEIEQTPTWKPKSSERLVKLPSTYLKKSLQFDFSKSSLAKAIETINQKIHLKVETLQDLKKTISEAKGEVKNDLKHQNLLEKRKYIELVSQQHFLREKHIRIKKKTLKTLLNRITKNKGEVSLSQTALLNKQKAARQRFDNVFDKAGSEIFMEPSLRDSKYSIAYSENLAAINKLMRTIKKHKMNSETRLDGQVVSKEEYIRKLSAEIEADLSLLEQEKNILGYMAKIIALDATALAEQVSDSELADSDVSLLSRVTSVVKFFVQN